jgi:ketosteroid isomerase-like protein
MSAPAEGLRAYLAAYAARDLDAIAALLSDDVMLQDWNLRVAGRAAVLAETRKNFEAVRSLRIEVLQVYEAGQRAAAELRIVVDETITLDVVDALQFDAAGRISAIRAYKG